MWSELVVCYLHIPKCGGKSIREMFRQISDSENTVFDCYWAMSGYTIEDLLWLSEAERRKVKYVFGHFFFGTHALLGRPATYATVLRDPVDRIISQYSYQLYTGGLPLAHRGTVSNLDEILDSGDFQYNNLIARMISGLGPKSCSDDELFDAAIGNVRRLFSFVGFLDDCNLISSLGKYLEMFVGRKLDDVVEKQNVGNVDITLNAYREQIVNHNKADMRLYWELKKEWSPR